MPAINSRVMIAGTEIPVTAWECTTGTYGSVGSVGITTSRKALSEIGFDLVGTAVKAPGPVAIDIYAAQSGQSPAHVFGGEYDSAEFDFLSDLVSMRGRDWAGILADSKRVLTSPLYKVTGVLGLSQDPLKVSQVSVLNQTPSAVATQLAEAYGFKPMVTPSPLGASGQPVTIGAYVAGSAMFTLTPRPVWQILNFLARAIGYEVYVTPDKELVFGPPPTSGQPIVLLWDAQPSDGAYPLKSLTVTHQPRRNNTFAVKVLSHHGQTAKVTQGVAYFLGNDVTVNNTTTIKPGFWTGSGGAGGSVQSLGASQLDGKPTYVFHIEGLTPDQAQQRAQAIAFDIAKREIIIEGTIDGLPSAVPQQPVILQGAIPEFAGRQFYLHSIKHTYRVPAGGGKAGDSGFLTELGAWTLPPGASSNPNQAVGP